jgi:hypothetical protein
MKPSEILLEGMLDNFFKMCKQELELTELPPIKFISNQPTVAGSSFGVFTDSGLQVVTMNRHPMDVMRTLAHELTHWKQRTLGQEMDGSDGSDTENQANATAGVIMRRFGKAYPECFTL